MQSAGLDELQAGIQTVGRTRNSLRYVDSNSLMEEREELESFLMRLKKDHERASLKLKIKKLRLRHLVPSLHGKNKWKMWMLWEISSSWALKLFWIVITVMKLEDDCSLEEKLWQTKAVYEKAKTPPC